MKCVWKDCVEVARPIHLKSDFGGIRNLAIFGIPSFEDSEVSQNFKFLCRSRALPRQRLAGKEARREARGRVFRTRLHTINHAHVAPRSLRSKFGKIGDFQISKFSQ